MFIIEPFDIVKKLLRNDISFVENLTKNRLSTAEGFFLHSDIDWNKSPLSRQQASKAGTYIHPIFPKAGSITPSYDDFHVGEIQLNQFTVMAHVTDPSDSRQVRYAVWTENNGQNDLKWYDGHCTDGTDYYWLA